MDLEDWQKNSRCCPCCVVCVGCGEFFSRLRFLLVSIYLFLSLSFFKLLPVLYFAGLALLPRQFKQERGTSKNNSPEFERD